MPISVHSMVVHRRIKQSCDCWVGYLLLVSYRCSYSFGAHAQAPVTIKPSMPKNIPKDTYFYGMESWIVTGACALALLELMTNSIFWMTKILEIISAPFDNLNR